MATDDTPRTQAGRARDRLFDDVDKRFGRNVARFVDHRIPAIEAEAAAAPAAQPEAIRLLRQAHRGDWCQLPGEVWDEIDHFLASEPAAAEPPALAELVEKASDWHYSDDFIGKIFRWRFIPGSERAASSSERSESAQPPPEAD